jgi:Na+-translocating ferredoxin:NAD+ oxidoreductase subunit B
VNSALENLTQTINSALPQTQCTRCGYPDCESYARAIAEQNVPINQCPPGGAQGIAQLAKITGRSVLALNPAHGTEGPRQLAVIAEDQCIGCTLCLDACPVDSILGGPKKMHTVINALCTGCELCVPVCPVDCISMQNLTPNLTGWNAWCPEQAFESKKRFEFHQFRLQRTESETHQRLVHQEKNLAARANTADGVNKKRNLIEAALAKAKAKHGSSL